MAVRLRLAIDGGSRGNPGTAAWGVAVLDEQGVCREGFGGLLGHATNNVAEYHGLLEALRLAQDRGAEELEILADSELIVRQIQGRYRVRNPVLKTLYAEAKRRIATLQSFAITHVRREANRDADRLVNVVLDRAGEDPGDTRLQVHETCGPDSA